ncbi:multidrug efflux RND transporter permease subunit [Shewanella oneidensis MR-1]|uniref:RND-type multidrug/detergent efflux system permease component VexA n=1 Tax=Shewanella oneidensis (strain ATCC 700550 / JCM 31522 / CIP 106686 / LMG 19005 / NCIMB 14063 / MR-1) TaxID=211586 RepID=K4PSX5_SHEON|nr:multidrug efflux RND transporter permease subunit [Shewanella oneidensis]AFV73600.1 RND-type multidrug/detergent efflux system permease component VexA [Shewanella oneidensis MR-1]MDX5998393.1 multidrug efflux RND transporter permease subunit [Shewanella oneidensis]MEE2027171.1 Efflux pump membrane transporter BepE [Shewanella oneidensis]QKG94645.1 multidrug efflux RND transporter permease subunit [Shewanella oneidensis MR-1]
MRFTDIFIRRPVLAASISFLLLLLGFNALNSMQVREYPKMTNTVVTVSTSYYGADANLIQGFITQPLEQALAQADNVDFMTSESFLGTSKISVYMKLNTDPNGALADILAKVNSVRSQLPKEAEDPSVEMSTGSQTSVLYISFFSDQINSSQLTDYLERVVKPQLFTIDGVAKVNLYGGIKYAMRIWLDPARMGAFNLSASDVMQVLQANNYQSAVGQTNSVYTLFNGTADTQVATIEELKRLVIGSKDGLVVRLGDIADVSLEKSHDIYRALANGKEAVVIGLDVTPTANPLTVAADTRALLPEIERNLPPSIESSILYDSSLAIDESIKEVVKTIGEAAIIVIVVITLFLGSLRAVVIPIVTIPLSLIGVAIIMQMFGFTLNLMTLLAMVLAIGLVVDDAIVVVENVDRHIKLGESPFRAAIIGTREIAVPVISMTITLAAVYAPIALMGGITGSLFKEFALTLAGSVFISGIVALTLSPMMCAKILKPHTTPNRFEMGVENFLTGLTRRYSNMLDAVMLHRPVIVAFAIIVFASLPVLFKFIPSELAPNEDKGVVMMMGTAPSTANLDYIQANMGLVTDMIKAQPESAASLAFVGVPSSSQAFGIAPLVPWSERDKSQKQMQEFFAKEVKRIPGMAITTFQMPELPGASSGLPIQFVITTSNSFASLFQIGTSVLEKVQKSPLFVYSEINLKFDSGTMKLHIKRDLAGTYGVTMQDIGITLATMMSDGYVNRINLDGRSYEVIPQVERKLRANPESLANYYVKAADGKSIPLSSLVEIEMVAEPRSLPHFNQMNALTVGGVASPGVAIGDAISFLQNIGDNELPKGYSYDFLGEARQFVTEGSALYATFLLAIAIIFLVLASQFESLKDPLVILVSVPLAISGALIVLGWTHVFGLAKINIYTQVGLITLVGLITKHGILMCEVAKEEQLHRGLSKLEAIKLAATIRLRPILMTTAAMIAGLLPLLFASGAGAVARFNIGVVIVAGLSIGTIFTLFVLPVIYTYLAEKHEPLPVFDEDADGLTHNS